MEKRIHLSIQWVPSQEMQADHLSRWTYCPGDYTLCQPLFHWLLDQFSPWIKPQIGCFASPGNAQLQTFICRYPHYQATRVDALHCNLQDFHHLYANPPWSVIEQWLFRLKTEKHLVCLLVCPYWVSTRWWPLLTGLHIPHTPVFHIRPFWGMFRNCHHQLMPPPRWPLISILLSGKFWKPNKFRLQLSKITWDKKFLETLPKSFCYALETFIPFGEPLAELSLQEIASAIIQIAQTSIPQARNAYAAALLIPELQGLRFEALLQPYKRLWNVSTEKYACFWSAGELLQALAAEPLAPDPSIASLRDRLILCCKLLLLHRSVDLSRVLRTTSMVGDSPFLMIQRKGWRQHKWEKILSLPSLPHISPWHLIVQYVNKTQFMAKPGTPLLLSLHHPFSPLSSNAIASLTKKLLTKHGIYPSLWGAHSTRGAAVLFLQGIRTNQ